MNIAECSSYCIFTLTPRCVDITISLNCTMCKVAFTAGDFRFFISRTQLYKYDM